MKLIKQIHTRWVCGVMLAASTGLARGQFGEPYSPPELSAPVLEVWALESPGMPVALIVIFGALTGVALRRSGRARPGAMVLLGALLLAAGLIVSASVVTTERERVAAVSREFIGAVAENNTELAGALMQPTVSLRMGYGARAEDRDALLVQIGRLHEQAEVRGAKVLDARCEIRSQTQALAYVRVKVEGNVSGFPIPPYSWWKLSFTRRSEPASPWRLAGIEPEWMTGIENPAGR